MLLCVVPGELFMRGSSREFEAMLPVHGGRLTVRTYCYIFYPGERQTEKAGLWEEAGRRIFSKSQVREVKKVHADHLLAYIIISSRELDYNFLDVIKYLPHSHHQITRKLHTASKNS